MRKFNVFLLLVLASFTFLHAQEMKRPSQHEITLSAAWAQLMYSENPNVYEVDRLYEDYWRAAPFEKSFHTQYYKRWRRAISDHLDENGYALMPDSAEKQMLFQAQLAKRETASSRTGAAWQVMGPQAMHDNSGNFKANHTNVRALARADGSTNIMYCGTEPGEIYKSLDSGLTWASVSENTLTDGAVTALALSPTNANIVFAGTGDYLLRSADGGNSWTQIINVNNLKPNEILVHPTNSSIVFAATDKGLYRSTDAGLNFTAQYSVPCYDIKVNPANPNILYLLKNNPSAIITEFFRSTDMGATWTLQNTGWYSSTDPNRFDRGGRLAVSNADSNRVYAYLIGDSKANDYGYIGVYRSDDGGLNWTLPNGPVGGPYTSGHPNLAMGTTSWNYHQGFYNCALMASNTNADEIIVGGLNLWRSTDAGLTFSTISGYMGGPLQMHVDNQDFRAFGSDYWITCDGGIYNSSDFFNTQPQVKMLGVHGADYWGFGQGWNEDVLVGGLYHNGDNVHHENYNTGNFLNLGGGESATGYVNPGENRRTYFSDIGGKIIPTSLTGAIQNTPFGMSPNEAYWSAESSEFEFHPQCWNIGFLGNENKIWKTENGGGAFDLLHEFGTDVASQVKYIEISRSNPEIMYVTQQPSSGNLGTLWKTTDAGQNWTAKSLPSTANKRKVLIALSPEDSELLWAAFPQSGNGNKIFKSTNGGTSWTNLTTTMLNNESVHSIVHLGGTPGGIYFCTNWTVYYRDDSMSDWIPYNTDLPIQFNTNIARPFYRDGKLRIACYGKGIWEADFYAPPTRPVAQIMVNSLTAICAGDTFHFEDYSMLNHTNASWNWSFQNGIPATSSLRNPSVVFTGQGQQMVTLTVTDGNGQSSIDTLMIDIIGTSVSSLAEGFENNFPPTDWALLSNGNLSWTLNTGYGGYANSPSCASCDNYGIDGQGSWTDMRAFLNLSNVQNAIVTFDVAYAPYGGIYSDTLEVLLSTDCAANLTSLYYKGGQTLATAGNFQNGPFLPSFAQWRTDTIDLSAITGQSEAVIIFRNHGYYGQVLYLDNIQLNGNPIIGLEAVPAVDYVILGPSPVMRGASVRLRSNLDDEFRLRLYDVQGQRVVQQKLRNGESFETSKLAAGIYFYVIRGGAMIRKGRVLVFE